MLKLLSLSALPLDTFQNEKVLGDSLECEGEHSSKCHWRQESHSSNRAGFCLHVLRGWG